MPTACSAAGKQAIGSAEQAMQSAESTATINNLLKNNSEAIGDGAGPEPAHPGHS
jgi:NAD+--asparagine ADP-ribosyltransferase